MHAQSKEMHPVVHQGWDAHPSRAWSSRKQEGPSSSMDQEEPLQQGEATAWLALQIPLPRPAPFGSADAVVLWRTLISPGEAFIAALEHQEMEILNSLMLLCKSIRGGGWEGSCLSLHGGFALHL